MSDSISTRQQSKLQVLLGTPRLIILKYNNMGNV